MNPNESTLPSGQIERLIEAIERLTKLMEAREEFVPPAAAPREIPQGAVADVSEPDEGGHQFTADQKDTSKARRSVYRRKGIPLTSGARVISTCQHVACVAPGHITQVSPAEARAQNSALAVSALRTLGRLDAEAAIESQTEHDGDGHSSWKGGKPTLQLPGGRSISVYRAIPWAYELTSDDEVPKQGEYRATCGKKECVTPWHIGADWKRGRA